MQFSGKCHKKEGDKLARYSCWGQSIVCRLAEYEEKEKILFLGNAEILWQPEMAGA